MALKVLGQAALAATTLTDIYTAPTPAVTSSIVVCNRGASVGKFRIAVAVAGAANDNKQYLFYDTEILPNETYTAVIGVTIGATDVIRAYSDIADLSVSVFGEEQ